MKATGMPEMRIKAGSYQSAVVEPGPWSAELDQGDLHVKTDPLLLEADRVYYLRITDSSTFQPGAVLNSWRWQVGIELRDPAFARGDWLLMAESAKARVQPR